MNDSKCVRVVPSADVEAGDVIQQMVRINSDGSIGVSTTLKISFQAIPVSGDPRPCRDRIATPFIKDTVLRSS